MSESSPDLSQPQDEPLTRILLIDDSKVMRKSALKMLGKDFDVVVAEDGESGWAMIQQDKTIEVVFTDLNMPKMNGFQLIQTVRSSTDEGIRNLPIIVVTGAENDDEAKERALTTGATDFITKPFNSTDLKARAQSHASYQRTTKNLQKFAAKDAVTGLNNEKMFLEQLERDFSFIARHGSELALVLIEVDDFNDLFLKIGRKAADSLVQQVARVMLKNVRKEDALGRVGLARFAVSLPASDAAGAGVLAQRICKTISGFKARLKGEVLPISVSVGVYIPVAHSVKRIGDIVEGAEKCLEVAKSQGGNQVVNRSQMPAVESVPGVSSDTDMMRLSVDEFLRQLASEGQGAVLQKVPAVLQQLAPLFNALTHEQKSQLRNQLLDS